MSLGRKKQKRALVWMAFLAYLFMIILVFPIDSEAREKLSGKGTVEEPYLLYTSDDLVWLSNEVNEKGEEFKEQYFRLSNDVDMTGIDFTPIGVFGNKHYFCGVFDGNGYAIKNISINSEQNNGLFGVLGGTVINLKVEGGNISGACCGIISSHAASNEAKIINCETKKVTVNGVRSGGIVDNFVGSVINSVSEGCILNGSSSYGGITSYGIGYSYGNYFTISSEEVLSGEEVIASGSEKIEIGSDNLDKIIYGLNTKYSLNDNSIGFSLDTFNGWKLSEDGYVDLLDVKRRNVILSYLSDFSGSGSADEPYVIDSVEKLRVFRDIVNSGYDFNGKYVRQNADVDLSGDNWIPIGQYNSDAYFYGTYDGNGYSIKNIFVNSNDNNGLFGMLGGTVMNLNIDGGTITGKCCGIISSHAASSNATIINCETRNVTVNGSRTGGIVDNFAGTVVNNVSEGCILNGTSNYGGISSHNIKGYSYGNFYSFSSDKGTDGEEVIVSGCEEIKYDVGAGKAIVDILNNNYRTYGFYSNLPYGSCNIWKLSDEGNIAISSLKQREVFLNRISEFAGNGSAENPYIINNVNELCAFRDAVNSGYSFDGEYFRQNADIDLSGEVWVPIGQFGTEDYFGGLYDGNGYTISNITTDKERAGGFFGVLGGTVVNLGIESGLIQGGSCGAIASHSTGSPMIVNCYNKAEVIGDRAGGIVDNFGSGSVIGCWSVCKLSGRVVGGISSYNVGTINLCKTSNRIIVPEDTMKGSIEKSEGNILLTRDSAQEIAKELYNNISKVKELSGINVRLYTYSTSGDKLFFSQKQYKYDLRVLIINNIRLFIVGIVVLLLFLCLLFKVGPTKVYEDDRAWWKRFVLLLAPVFLFFYMFFIHSPIEFFVSNNSEFDFVFGDFAYRYIGIAIGCSVLIAAVLSFLKGWIIDILACAVFGIDLCMYIQLNFMNGSLGLLDGNEKPVDLTWNYINLAIWGVLFFLPFIFFLVFKEYRRKLIVFLCGSLCMMQITSIVVALVQSPSSVFERDLSKYILTTNDQFKVSSQNNIIFLIIDAYSNDYLVDFFDTYPNVKDVVKDFTYYNNADCHYEGSVFSINYLASGTEWDMSIPIDEWCKTAWNNDKTNEFYSRLKEQDYIFNIYSSQLYALSNEAQHDMIGKVDNMIETECSYRINKSVMQDLFINASMYRFAPMILKKNYEFSGSEYSSAYTIISKNNKGIDTVLIDKNAEFYSYLLSNGLKTDDSKKYYIIRHLEGVHGPYTTDENCKKVEESTLLETERGCWRYIEEYLNQLKELGVYDQSTIIITADHGKHHDYVGAQPIFFIKNAGEVHDEYEETNAPISFSDIMPTVLYLSGAEYSDYGTTIFEHSENEQRERTLYVRIYDKELPNVPKRDSPTDSILNCFYKYVYTGDKNDLLKVGEVGPTEKVLWTDSFY